MLNLADCEEHLGQIVKAREHFGLAASGFARTDPRRELALKRAATLEIRLARLTITLAPGAPPGTLVRLGNTILDAGAFGAPIPIDPGDVSIVVVSPGHVNRTYDLRLADGESAEMSVDIGPIQPTNTVIRTVEERRPLGARRITGLAMLGVGFVGVTIGAVTGALAVDKASTVKAHCDTNVVCDEQGFDAASDGKVLSPVSTVAILAGAGLMAIGTVFFFWGGKSAKPTTAFDVSPFGATLKHSF